MTSKGQDSYRLATREEIASALGGMAKVDLFVFLASASKYLLFVPGGEKVSAAKIESLKAMGADNVFARVSAPGASAPTPKTGFNVELKPSEVFEGEKLGRVAAEKLKTAYRDYLLNPTEAAAGPLSQLISESSETVLSLLAPESVQVKEALVKNLKNLRFMNDVAGLTTLSLMVAQANEFESRSVFQTLSQAVLVMDFALADLEDHSMKTYYRNRKELPSHILEKIMAHPVKSEAIASKMPIMNETMRQLILLHHELHNGKGYHRGIKTSQVLPLARVLALAVDLYEQLRGAELRGETSTLKDILLGLREYNIEPHLRRHSTKLIQNTLKFLDIEDK